jgi:sugar transferase (PEP-CTERM system associated)
VFKQYYPIRNIFFVVGEGIAIFLSVFVATMILLGTEGRALDPLLMAKILLITIVCQLSLYYADLYDIKVNQSIFDLSTRLVQSLGFTAIILALIYFAFPALNIGTITFLISAGFVVLLVMGWRLGYAVVLTRGIFDKKIVLIGSDELAHKIINEIQDKPDCGYQIACIVLERHNPDTLRDALAPIIRKKKYQGLCDLSARLGISTIVVAIKERRGELPTGELLRCRIDGIEVLDGNSFYEMLTGKLMVDQINPSWLIFSDGFRKSWLKRFLKRYTDLILSSLMLILLGPILLAIMLMIKIDSRGPVFYSQERVGERRKIYMIYKFRSMVDDAEKLTGPTMATENDPRITRIGRFLRKWRIDEIPQLINVFKGEMSFVGPRPERDVFVQNFEKAIPYYGERLSVKPGITGWAQICFNYTDSIEDTKEKLNYDLFYIKNMSAMMDLMIVLRTIKIVLFGKGAR